jgi:hypothetical protein
VHSQNARESFRILRRAIPRRPEGLLGPIMQRIDELGSEPYKGRPVDRGGLFTSWVRPYRYRIYYRIDGDSVVIIHIRLT